MKHEINAQSLAKLKKEYLANPKNTVVRHALSKTKISDLVYVDNAQVDTVQKFNIEVKSLPVCNQRQSGRCWIFAGLNVIREKIAKEINCPNFELSQNYISLYDKIEKCNWAMEVLISMKDRDIDDRELKFILSCPVGDGGQWDMFVSLVDKYGLMPKDAHFENTQSNSTMFSNRLINTTLRQFAAAVHNKSDKEVEALRDEYLVKFYNLLSNCFGVPAEKFEFSYIDKDGKLHEEGEYTPVEFAEKFHIKEYLSNMQSIVNAPTSDKEYLKTYTIKYLGNVVGGKKVIHLNLEMSRVEELIIDQLKDGKVVWFGSDVGYYGDRTSGTWDISMFDYKTPFDMDYEMDKAESMDYLVSAMNHAMVITGVQLDKAGKPVRWKIENSWGADVGDKGYFVMSERFFEKYVYQAVVEKDYLNEKELAALKDEPVELKPWDPLGTLAD